jgi:hypothetical protein
MRELPMRFSRHVLASIFLWLPEEVVHYTRWRPVGRNAAGQPPCPSTMSAEGVHDMERGKEDALDGQVGREVGRPKHAGEHGPGMPSEGQRTPPPTQQR